MTRYVALLRGINVGGNNIIKMAALKACFEEQGFERVSTYIQSGNVIFGAPDAAGALTTRIEEVLGDTFGYSASVVLRTAKQMHDVVAKAPAGFGEDVATYRYDVLFLKGPLTAAAALEEVPVTEGVDAVSVGGGVLYSSRLVSRASESMINKLGSRPISKSLTIRNWNTTTKLNDLMQA